MSFVWVQGPNIPPSVAQPEAPGPTEVSTEVGLVANTVNVAPIQGVLSYNTANIGYDVVYELPSLNVRDFYTEHLIGGNITANVATLNTLTINTATIGTVSISNAIFTNASMGNNPNSNLQIATKGYVDALVANSIPLGGNLQLLIQAAGDLLVGVSDNTANRVAVGTAGQVLMVSSSANTKVTWRTIGKASSFRDVFIRTHTDYPLCNSTVELLSAKEIIMDDGTRTTDWPITIASSTANGNVGYLDTGTIQPNTWYEIYAIRNPTTGDRGLLLHQALDRKPDPVARMVASETTVYGINISGAGTAYTTRVANVAQQFVPTLSGPLTSADMSINRVGIPTGNCWLTLEPQDGTGNASGVVLATSRKRKALDITIETFRSRFIFDTPFSVVANTGYCLVFHTDYPDAGVGNGNFLSVHGNSVDNYLGGNGRAFNVTTNSWMPSASTTPPGPVDLYFRVFIEANNTSSILPTGYTQKCLISYVCTNQRGEFKEYTQRNRKMSMLFARYWRILDATGTVPLPPQLPTFSAGTETFDVSYGVPPIPCIVEFALPNQTSGGHSKSVGNVDSASLTGNTTFNTGTFVEVDNGVYANSGVGSYFQPYSPVFVEHQATMIMMYSSLGWVYMGSVEF